MSKKLRKGLLSFLLMFLLVMTFAGAVQASSVYLKKIGKKTYLYNSSTNKPVSMSIGVHEVPSGSGDLYYFRETSGRVYSNCLLRTKKGTYYAQKNGKLIRGWRKSGKYKYYFNPKTCRAVTGLKKISGKYYYFRPTGAMATGIIKIGKYTFYFDPGTGAVTNGWKKVGKYTYYFDKANKNHMATGLYKIGGKYYYFGSNGRRTTGIVRHNGRIYFFSPTMRTGWVSYKGSKYYFKKNGQAVTGWMTLSGKKYYFNPTSGVMQKGWVTINGKTYYMDASTGAMTTGSKKIGNTTYNFGKNGYITASGGWYIQVNKGTQVVTVFQGGIPVQAFLCSTGLYGPTPNGTRYIGSKHRWWTLDGGTYGQYCMHLVSSRGQTFSPYLFHSVMYSQYGNNRSLYTLEYNKLGSPASHGCIRMPCGAVYYIYTHCPVGTQVYIFNGSKSDDPLQRPAKLTISTSYDPTDPNI